MCGYLDKYTEKIIKSNMPQLASAVCKTVDSIVPKYISNFSYKEHVTSLLMGDVQSGKTSHMFGIMCAAADEGFGLFILLTTDNIILQQQTKERALKDLPDFCVCGEDEYIKFEQNNMHKPVVIILKKNPKVLRRWKNDLKSSNLCVGNAPFIVDDEGDAATPNTQVNKSKQSTINKLLTEILNLSTSSIFMQVTGTPQALLLQTIESKYKPYFIYYFEPGRGYIGGNSFFTEPNPPQMILTDNNESCDLLCDDEFPENGLKKALITHLITAAHIFLNGGKVCNFLIHPSMKTIQHIKFAEKVGEYLNEIASFYNEQTMVETFQEIYNGLKRTKINIADFDAIRAYVEKDLAEDKVNIRVLNSISNYDENTQYLKGNNILVGGNSLGRGVTFPQLQTIYYCRLAKNPQADTMWQHSRMFGYDRDFDLMRIFMPPQLFKLFTDINNTNNEIIKQIKRFNDGGSIKLKYPPSIKPTRSNVIDKQHLSLFSGGVNYFPFNPGNVNIEAIDKLVEKFTEEQSYYSVGLQFIYALLEQFISTDEEWDVTSYKEFVKALAAVKPIRQGILIVRRNRDIGKGTGTLLSPNDRSLGDLFTEDVVLTLYKVAGNKGWDGRKIWIPNIKFPSDQLYYNIKG